MFPVAAAISVPADISLGSAIGNPRPITGAWEQRSALGQAVGFDVELATDVLGTPKSLAGVEQHVVHIWITTYVRINGHSQRSFWSSDYAAAFSWQNNHLVLHEPVTAGNARPVDLDITFDPRKDTWRGTLQNEWFSGEVTLPRPFVPHGSFPIIGDWIEGSAARGSFACLHVALGADSAFVMWSDHIDLSGFVIYGRNNTAPPSTWEWYGELDMDPEMRYVGSNMLFFTGTDMGGNLVLGNVSAEGTTFAGSSAHFGNGFSNGTFNPFAWQRSTPDCSSIS